MYIETILTKMLKECTENDMVNAMQTKKLSILEWFILFAKSADNTIREAKQETGKVLARSNFWARNWKIILNLTQKLVLNELVEEFYKNNTAELTTRRYVQITKVDRYRAIREINDMVKKGILVYIGNRKGHGVKYRIKKSVFKYSNKSFEKESQKW